MLHKIVRLILAPPARLIYRPVIEGRHRVPRSGPVILASNHLSFIDSVVIPLVAPRSVLFLAKSEYFDGPGFKGLLTKWYFTALGAVPVKRGTHGAGQAALESATEILNSGEIFGIYPEGTRSRDGRLYRGKTGVGWLALTTGAPVVPVALIGTEHIQAVGSRLPKIRQVTVRFGTPLIFDGGPELARSAQARRKVTDEIMNAIHDLSGQERAPGYNEPARSAV
jgi:1-acyl-sn-glycerol-3-phosphate acyltransferase